MEAQGILSSISVDEHQVMFRRGRMNAKARRVDRVLSVPLEKVIGVDLDFKKGWLVLHVAGATPPSSREADPYSIAFVPRKHAAAKQGVADEIRARATGSTEAVEQAPVDSPPDRQPTPEPPQRAASPAKADLSWWYRVSYSWAMVSSTVALALYGLGRLLVVATIVSVLVAVLL